LHETAVGCGIESIVVEDKKCAHSFCVWVLMVDKNGFDLDELEKVSPNASCGTFYRWQDHIVIRNIWINWWGNHWSPLSFAV
jgi:hypothetical protein